MNLLELPKELILKIILFNFIKEYQTILICNNKTINQFRYNFIIHKLLEFNSLKIIYNKRSLSFKNKVNCLSVQKFKLNKTIFDIVFKYEKDLKLLTNN